MKKIISLIIGTILLCSLCSCSFVETLSTYSKVTDCSSSISEKEFSITAVPKTECDIEKQVSSESLFEFLIPLETNEKIVYYAYEDYDDDDSFEAFIVTKNELEKGFGKLWYIKNDISKMLFDQLVYDDIVVFTPFGYGAKFICFRTYDEQYSRIWGVDNGEPIEEPISNVGQRFTILQNGYDFILMQSAHDGWISEALDNSTVFGAHTHKNYYFYYDYDKGFCEYGGVDIGSDVLLEYKNGENYLQYIIDNGGVIQSILKRNNNTININYCTVDYNIETKGITVYNTHYITLRIDEGEVFFDDYGDGIYLPALVPEIAVY